MIARLGRRQMKKMKKTALLVLFSAMGLALVAANPVLAKTAGTDSDATTTEDVDVRIGVPEIVSPESNATTTADLEELEVNWSDVTGASGYELEYFIDNAYATSTAVVATTNSETTIDNPADGMYYLRVRAKDASGHVSQWSNGKNDPYVVYVGVKLPEIPVVLQNKAQCMTTGWGTAGGNIFHNQGECVAYYNQQIRSHIENLLRIIKDKMTEMVTAVQEKIKERNQQATQNNGQEKKLQNTENTQTANGSDKEDKTNNAGGNGNGNKDADTTGSDAGKKGNE